jgi:hypothetical protein
MSTDNLDRLICLFDDFAEKVVDKMDPLVESSSELLEKGLDKVAGAGFRAVERITVSLKEKRKEHEEAHRNS